MDNTFLSSSTTIAKYKEYEINENRIKIADFILERFTERYIAPLASNPRKKNGFCTMAINCLLIESLESFCQGWPDTKRKGKEPFEKFFQRCSNYDNELSIFFEYAEDFYLGIRCGILHQAETTREWHITRKGPLFDISTKKINATKFHDEVNRFLHSYCAELKNSDWKEEIWLNFREKMKAVIQNCGITI